MLNAAGEVLIDQRLEEGLLGGMWELPGGKQEQDETIETCIARELKEELGIAVTVGAELITVDHAYSHKSCASWCISATWSRGSRSPLPVSRCVGCAQRTWGITPFRPPMLGSLRLCLAAWKVLPTLRQGSDAVGWRLVPLSSVSVKP